jgi:rhodanese-related sulfurtransferase
MREGSPLLASFANLRDLGGLLTEEGVPLRFGHLLRSATLARAPASSTGELTGLFGAGDYLDLRTDREVAREGRPDALISHGWRWSRYPLQSVDPLDCGSPGPIIIPDDMLSSHADAASSVVDRLIGHDRPVIVACSLGKDRTGIVVALLLHWLGLTLDTICADYLLSNSCLSRQRYLLPDRWRDPDHLIGRVQAQTCLSALARANEVIAPKLTASELERLRDAMLSHSGAHWHRLR